MGMRAHRIAIGLVSFVLFGAAGRLAAQDGSVRWKPQAGQYIYSSPAVTADGSTIYVTPGMIRSRIAAWCAPSTATVRRSGNFRKPPTRSRSTAWNRRPRSARMARSTSAAATENLCARQRYGREKFEFNSLAAEINNSPTIDADGNVYIISSDSVLHALTRDLIPRGPHIAGYSLSIDTSAAIGSDGDDLCRGIRQQHLCAQSG